MTPGRHMSSASEIAKETGKSPEARKAQRKRLKADKDRSRADSINLERHLHHRTLSARDRVNGLLAIAGPGGSPTLGARDAGSALSAVSKLSASDLKPGSERVDDYMLAGSRVDDALHRRYKKHKLSKEA